MYEWLKEWWWDIGTTVMIMYVHVCVCVVYGDERLNVKCLTEILVKIMATLSLNNDDVDDGKQQL